MTTETKLLNFHAEWCGPCNQQEPILDTIDERDDVTVERYDIDTDEGQELANEHTVRSVPTTVVLDDGVVVEQFTGLTDERTIIESLESLGEI